MPIDRRQRTASDRDSYTSLQQRKRIRSSKREDGLMSDKQCISLMPSSSDTTKLEEERSPTASKWKGWIQLPNEESPNTRDKNQEFPPLTKGGLYDSWYTPEPIKNWADYMDEEESLENKKPNDINKRHSFKRKLLLTESREKSPKGQKPRKPILTDEHRLAQRQKQIDYGKNTLAYGKYITETPRHCRQLTDPRTPDKFQMCSTRSWDGQVKAWRRRLHEWDPPTQGTVDLFALTSSVSDVKAKAHTDLEECGSLTSSNSGEDFIKDLNIDARSLLDNLPL